MPPRFFNVFELGIQQGKNAQYDTVGENNIRTSIQDEKGTLAMYSVKQKDDPNMAYMVEIYANDEAYEKHRQTAHFNDYLKQTEKMVVNKQMIDIAPAYLGNKGELHFRSAPQ